MKRTLIALLAATAILCAAAVTACAEASAESQPAKYTAQFAYVHDWAEPKVPSGMVRIKAEMDARAAEAAQEAQQAEQEAIREESYGGYDESLNNNPEYLNYGHWDSADGFYSQGVRSGVGSDTETYYSSRVAYHERTGEWHTDDEGYWRDADGYYIVSSDDYAPESVVQTSKGEGKVYDGGTESGNFDMYVDW